MLVHNVTGMDVEHSAAPHSADTYHKVGLTSHLSTDSNNDKWVVWGRQLPKGEIVYFCQTIVIFTVIVSAIINISIGNSSDIWLTLLSISLGAILPNPKVKPTTKKVLVRSVDVQ